MADTEAGSAGGATVGVVAETAAGERRVALVPKMVERLAKRGVRVVAAAGAGAAAFLAYSAYSEAGAAPAEPDQADIVVRATPPTDAENARLRKGSVVIGFLAPLRDPDRVAKPEQAGVIAFAME